MNFDEIMRKLLFLPDAGTEFADSIDHLHFFVIITTMVGALIVALLAVYWLIRYRRRGKPTGTRHIKAPRWFEVGWIGTLLVLFIMWWVIGFSQYLGYATPPSNAEEVYVTAKQWMWKFSHPNGRSSVGVLVVPVDRKVKLIMTSRDVIHSFYVPSFRLKQDVLPGRYTSAWFKARSKGIYPVYCAEYCGTSHSRMWASVVALPQGSYERWLDGEVPPLVAQAASRAALEGQPEMRVGAQQQTSMAEQGRQAAADEGCLSCHTTDGQPHIGPTWRGLFGRQVELDDGTQVVADEEYLTRSMMDPQEQIVKGFKPVMPTYLGSLSQPKAAAIVEFIKSLEGGGVEPLVPLPPAQVIQADAGADASAAVSADAAPDAVADAAAPDRPTLGERLAEPPSLREPAEEVTPEQQGGETAIPAEKNNAADREKAGESAEKENK